MIAATHPRLLGLIRTVIQKALTLEKGSRLTVDGVRLHPSEIHVLLLVKAGRGTNATRMAETLGITKGAISQTLSRLERKGLLTKQSDPQAKNELTMSFTPLGRRAAKRCQAVQDRVQVRFDAYLSSVGDEARRDIGRFLREMSIILDEAG
jgi:DNA-binding MarR family transcriptional regulator